MIHRTLAQGMALAAVLAILAGCSNDEPDEAAAANDAGQAATAAADAPTGAAPPAELLVQQAWTRAVPPNAPVAAGYVTLINGTQVDDRLVEVRSAAAERVEIHEMLSAGDGTMQMREVEGGLPLPGGISVDLRPGGLHLMFFTPDTERWQAGGEIPVTLVFEGVGEREVGLEVFAPGEAPTDGGVRMRGPAEDSHDGHADGMDHGQGEARDHHGHEDDAPDDGDDHHGH